MGQNLLEVARCATARSPSQSGRAGAADRALCDRASDAASERGRDLAAVPGPGNQRDVHAGRSGRDCQNGWAPRVSAWARNASLAALALVGVAAPLAAQTTATFVGIDTTTQGDWRGPTWPATSPRYGTLGIWLYPDGGTADFPPMFVRGGGTIQASGQAASFGGACTLDPRAPRRYTTNNGGALAFCGDVAVPPGSPWPTGARFAAGLYNRTIQMPAAPDGTPLTIGIHVPSPMRVRFYLVDFNADTFLAALGLEYRVERVDVFEETDAPCCGSGIGAAMEKGRLLDSQTFSHFERGIYPAWDVTGPVVFVFTPIEPHLYPDGRPITDTNGLAVESGIFLDPIRPPSLSAPTHLRIVGDRE